MSREFPFSSLKKNFAQRDHCHDIILEFWLIHLLVCLGGELGADHSDWRSCPGEEVVGVSLTHPFKLASAAGTPQAWITAGAN